MSSQLNEGIFHSAVEITHKLSNATQATICNAGEAAKHLAHSGYEKVAQTACDAGEAIKDGTCSGYAKAKDAVEAGYGKMADAGRSAYDSVSEKFTVGEESAEKKERVTGGIVRGKKKQVTLNWGRRTRAARNYMWKKNRAVKRFMNRKADDARDGTIVVSDYADRKSGSVRLYMAKKMRAGADTVQGNRASSSTRLRCSTC